MLGSSAGHCTLTGLAGFGGNQFPDPRPVSEHPLREARPERSDLHLPGRRGRCGDLVRHQQSRPCGRRRPQAAHGECSLSTASPCPRPRRPACGTSGGSSPRPVGSGGLSAAERDAAQAALDALQDSNISLQLATITTRWAQNIPATCRVGLVSRSPNRFKVYLFWVPWLAAEPYIWLNMDSDRRPSRRHVLARDHPTRPARRQADQERPKREPTLGRHHVALPVRAGTGQEGPRDPGCPRRRRAATARRNVRGAQEREPQASPELAAIEIPALSRYSDP